MFEHAPTIDILGSFFPIWLFCVLGGLILTFAARFLFLKVGIESELGPRIIIYPSMLTLFACGIWLFGFRY